MGDDEAVIAGIGCRRECPADDIVALVREAERLAAVRVGALAGPAFRGDALRAAAAALGVRLIAVERGALEAAQDRCVTRSAAALAAVGVGSVAEGCALAAAGAGGRLVLARIAGARATCALAVGG